MKDGKNQNLNSTLPSVLTLEDRKSLRLTGVLNVDGYDDNRVTVKTAAGTLAIKGSNIRIAMLSVESGELRLEGVFDSMVYTRSAVGSGIAGLLR